MGVIGGHRDFGYFNNGDFSLGNNTNFTWGTYQSTGGYNNGPYLQITGGGGSGVQGNDYIPVDTSKNYQMVIYARTITRGSDGDLAGGHIGFASYDEDFNFIDLRNNKGIGDTTLTRAASPGDSVIYVADASGWSTSTTASLRGGMFFGGQYPYSGGYTRYTVSSNFYPNTGITDLGGGEWSITLSGTLPTWSDLLVNGEYPIGTYVANGRSGGTYNYALGAPNYPETWTKYSSSIFTGESRNSSTPFRYGTKYIRYLILRNYNNRLDTQDHVWGISNFFFGQSIDGRDYSNLL